MSELHTFIDRLNKGKCVHVLAFVCACNKLHWIKSSIMIEQFVFLLYRETQSALYGSTISVPGPIMVCPPIPAVCWTSWRRSN